MALPSRVLGPRFWIILIASSNLVNCTEQISGSIKSLTDSPSGCDRWWIILYSPGCFFGTYPIGDTLKVLNGGVLKGPTILCAFNHFAKLSLIMSWALFADGIFYKTSCCGLFTSGIQKVRGQKLAQNDTQRILYVQWKFDTIGFKHDQTSIVIVMLCRHTRPNVIQRHVDVALSKSDYWLFFSHTFP